MSSCRQRDNPHPDLGGQAAVAGWRLARYASTSRNQGILAAEVGGGSYPQVCPHEAPGSRDALVRLPLANARSVIPRASSAQTVGRSGDPVNEIMNRAVHKVGDDLGMARRVAVDGQLTTWG